MLALVRSLINQLYLPGQGVGEFEQPYLWGSSIGPDERIMPVKRIEHTFANQRRGKFDSQGLPGFPACSIPDQIAVLVCCYGIDNKHQMFPIRSPMPTPNIQPDFLHHILDSRPVGQSTCTVRQAMALYASISCWKAN